MISVQKIKKTYGKKGNVFIALDNINLSINDSFVVILGESGSGKTTLLNLIGCLDLPDEGKIIIDGVDINKLSPNELSEFRNKNIGYIFQNFFLEPNYTVLDNVSMPLVIRGIKKKNRDILVKEILEKVNLSSKINNKAKELSGGERQRVAIARALVGNPQIILADEPTGNLDSKNGDEVLNILYNLSKEGKQVIMVTHNEAHVKYANKVIIIKDGKIIDGE